MAIPATRHGPTFWPSTAWGRLALGFLAAFFVLGAVFIVMGATGQQGGETFADNLWLAVPGLAGSASAILALVTGLFAVIWRRERSVLVLAAMALGAFVSLFTVAEVAFPH